MANTDLTGANGSVTFANFSGSPTAANVYFTSGRIYRQEFPTTRPGSLMQRVALSELRGSGGCRVFATDDATSPLPTSAVGTVTILQKSGQTWAFKAVFTSVGGLGYNSVTGQPQVAEYSWTACSTATADTVTVTG